MSLLKLIKADNNIPKEVKDYIEDMWDANKPEPPEPEQKPKTKITQEMCDRAKRSLVKETIDDCIWLCNPSTKKWVKKDSPLGKLMVLLIA